MQEKDFEMMYLAIEMKKNPPQILMSQKPIYLGLSIIEMIKIVMYEFSYNYAKTKYAKLC